MKSGTGTIVVNHYDISKDWVKDPSYVYIGRQGHGFDGYFGNPIRLGRGASRGGTIEQYKTYFYNRLAKDPEFKLRVQALKGKKLVCFCKPQPCHGDVIKEYLDSQP